MIKKIKLKQKKTENIKGKREGVGDPPFPISAELSLSPLCIFFSHAQIKFLLLFARSSRPIDHRRLFSPIFHPRSM